MTWVAHGTGFRGQHVAPAGSRPLGRSLVVSAPRGITLAGMIAALAGAWGAIVPYVGPTFGYSSNGQAAWTWNLMNSLLYLIPGAVALAIGLTLMGSAGYRWAAGDRPGYGLAGTILMATGAWFVVGPAVWSIFFSTPVFGAGVTPLDSFVNQIGYNFGPGLILAVIGGMVFKAVVPDRQGVLEQNATDMTTTSGTTSGMNPPETGMTPGEPIL